jgi:hypothetical protein
MCQRQICLTFESGTNTQMPEKHMQDIHGQQEEGEGGNHQDGTA